jgi:hypothetical protein
MTRLLLALCLFAAPALADTTVVPTQRTSVSVSGTITTGNTFQDALGADGNRTGCAIQNTSTHTMYFYLGPKASATTGNSIQVSPNGIFNCSAWGPVALTDEVAITTSTTGDTFAGFYQH